MALTVKAQTSDLPSSAAAMPTTTPEVTMTPAVQLPCMDSTPACVEKLTTLAVSNSRELQVIGQAMKLQRTTMWTTWLAADSFNPIGSVLKLARNIAGGGERGAAKLTLAQMEMRQSEVARNLREQILTLLVTIETASQRARLSDASLQTHTQRVAILETGYKFGDGDTAAMLPLWERTDQLKAQIETAGAEAERTKRRLIQLVTTPPRVTGGY